MTVDLKTVRPGDAVHFRCGGSAMVLDTYDSRNWSYTCGLVFKGYSDTDIFTNNGIYLYGKTSLLDIISTTPRALTPEERLAKIAEITLTEFQYLKSDGAAGRILKLARGEP